MKEKSYKKIFMEHLKTLNITEKGYRELGNIIGKIKADDLSKQLKTILKSSNKKTARELVNLLGGPVDAHKALSKISKISLPSIYGWHSGRREMPDLWRIVITLLI